MSPRQTMASARADAMRTLGDKAVEDVDFKLYDTLFSGWSWRRLWPEKVVRRGPDGDCVNANGCPSPEACFERGACRETGP